MFSLNEKTTIESISIFVNEYGLNHKNFDNKIEIFDNNNLVLTFENLICTQIDDDYFNIALVNENENDGIYHIICSEDVEQIAEDLLIGIDQLIIDRVLNLYPSHSKLYSNENWQGIVEIILNQLVV